MGPKGLSGRSFVFPGQILSKFMKISKSTRYSKLNGNVGTVIAFRLGLSDVEILKHEFQSEISTVDLISLPNYHIYLKLMIDGVVSRPFSGETLMPMGRKERSVDERVCMAYEDFRLVAKQFFREILLKMEKNGKFSHLKPEDVPKVMEILETKMDSLCDDMIEELKKTEIQDEFKRVMSQKGIDPLPFLKARIPYYRWFLMKAFSKERHQPGGPHL
jgi:hypothetical protein